MEQNLIENNTWMTGKEGGFLRDTSYVAGNTLFNGDNLHILRSSFPSECIDLIYIDPPFCSGKSYVLASPERPVVFRDIWRWDQSAEQCYQEILNSTTGPLIEKFKALRVVLGKTPPMAYLLMMVPRLIELHRVLKPTGSFYLHADPGLSHYLKILLDTIFGIENFRNEIAWKRTSAHNDAIARYGRIHDSILLYSKTSHYTFHNSGERSPEQLKRYKYRDEQGAYRAENLTAPHASPTRTFPWRGTHPGNNRQWRFSVEELERLYEQGRILLQTNGSPRKDGLKVYLSETTNPPLQDFWGDITFGPTTGERVGYPTQKPLALLQRIITASSNMGDTILDAFAGSASTLVAAQNLGRRWIGIEKNSLSIEVQEHRLHTSFPNCSFVVVRETNHPFS